MTITDTAISAPRGSGGGVNPGSLAGFLGGGAGRLDLLSSTLLHFHAFLGDKRVVNGESVDFSTAFQVDITDNTIDSNGLDTGNTPANDVLHYVYISNSQATDFPLSIRLSTVNGTGNINGFMYLGGTGNEANWQFIGRALPRAGNFLFSASRLLVQSEYNQLPFQAVICPNYVDNNSTTSYVFTGTGTWKEIVAGASEIQFLSDGNHSVEFNVLARAIAGTATFLRIGIGIDAATDSAIVSQIDFAGMTQGAGYYRWEPNQGLVRAFLSATTTNLLTATVAADLPRDGAPEDPFATFLVGTVWA